MGHTVSKVAHKGTEAVHKLKTVAKVAKHLQKGGKKFTHLVVDGANIAKKYAHLLPHGAEISRIAGGVGDAGKLAEKGLNLANAPVTLISRANKIVSSDATKASHNAARKSFVSKMKHKNAKGGKKRRADGEFALTSDEDDDIIEQEPMTYVCADYNDEVPYKTAFDTLISGIERPVVVHGFASGSDGNLEWVGSLELA